MDGNATKNCKGLKPEGTIELSSAPGYDRLTPNKGEKSGKGLPRVTLFKIPNSSVGCGRNIGNRCYNS